MKKRIGWKLFLIVWLLAVFGAIAVIPYQLAIVPPPPSVPIRALIIGGIVQTGLLLAALTATGLFLTRKVGLGLPHVENWLANNAQWRSLQSTLRLSICAGVFAGLTIIGLEKAIFEPALNAASTLPELPDIAIWKRFLASFYGGITEEVMLRLFLMTLLVWVGNLLSRRSGRLPSLAILWTANVLAAVLFGLGHLPATVAAGLPLSGLIVTRALLLNGLAGVVFGWLYWKRGLESAIVAHFCTDIILHVLFPLVVR